MSQYIPPDPAVAERVYRMQQESRSYGQRLQTRSDDELRAMLRQPAEPPLRVAALQVLSMRLIQAAPLSLETSQLRRVELYAEFLEDAQPEIARLALSACPLLNEELITTVRRQLNSPHDQVKGQAALALARIKDSTLHAKCQEWLKSAQESDINLATEVLKSLDTEEARRLLIERYEMSDRGEAEQAVVALALLRMGDRRGANFLGGIAQRAQGALAATAAYWIYISQPAEAGLRLMLHVLDTGDTEAQQSLVSQICRAHLESPHAFTADGIHEARLWIEGRLESPAQPVWIDPSY